ncbi:hypothetical protein ccbrp13_26840 [Ktedonobacteria bacterium brp13]|nr:hypothetical protein ccbrp13_26840 [Ktedonobacteria bacterium brp13]
MIYYIHIIIFNAFYVDWVAPHLADAGIKLLPEEPDNTYCVSKVEVITTVDSPYVRGIQMLAYK